MIRGYLKHYFGKLTSQNTRRKIVILFLNLKRAYYKRQGKNIINLLHIGKAGGSAIKYALKDNLITEKYVLFMHSHTIRLKDIPKGEWVVFFVRDPVSRFISAFNSTKRKGKPKHFVPWSKEEKEAFKTFKTANDLAKSLSSKNITLRKSAIKAMKNIDHVRTSYWDWFQNKNYLLNRINDIFFIGRQENLNKDFGALIKILSLSGKISLPTSTLNMNKSPIKEETYLSKEAKKNVKKWYKNDYEFLSLIQKGGLVANTNVKEKIAET